MTTPKPSRLVPKLRFPEFCDDWLSPQLDYLYSFKRTNSLSRDKLNYENGEIRNIHYGDIHTKFRSLFRLIDEFVPFINPGVLSTELSDDALCEEGDMVLADASENLDDVGKAIEIISLNGERVVAGTHTILATRRGCIPVVGFGGYLFQSASVRAGIKREAQGAKVYGISANRISPLTLPIPPTASEQQKIASCLSSLDEVIEAQTRKLEALRQHKKGLMQQLFPLPGETTPRVRFPEFEGTGEWEEKLLRDCASYENGKAYEQNVVPGGRYIVVNSRFVSTDGLVRKYSNEKFCIANMGDVLMVLSDLPNGRALAKCYFVDADDLYAVNQRVCKLRPYDIYGRFLFYILNRHPKLLAYDDGMNQTHLKKDSVLDCTLNIPSQIDEQQKIADCLTSLDELITAQTRKLEALRQHKKGLMQQLFPITEAK